MLTIGDSIRTTSRGRAAQRQQHRVGNILYIRYVNYILPIANLAQPPSPRGGQNAWQ